MKQSDRIQNGHQYGFFMIPNEMIDSHIENMGALGFVVYSVLMRHANGSSQCFPSYNTLVKKSALSRPTIAKCIEHLVSKGYIRKLEIGHSKGHATTYQLLDLSLVPTSKPDELVNEVNQLATLTSKGNLPVTSKGGLPQLVNEVNSNNTHITKPINNNTHTRAYENFESQSLSDRIEKAKKLEAAKWQPQEIDCKALAKDNEFAEYIRTIYLPTTAHYSGKEVDMSNAKNWIVDGYYDPAKRLKVEIQLEAFETWRSRQQKSAVQASSEPSYIPRPHPSTWTEEQQDWTIEDWQLHLKAKQSA